MITKLLADGIETFVFINSGLYIWLLYLLL